MMSIRRDVFSQWCLGIQKYSWELFPVVFKSYLKIRLQQDKKVI